MFFKKNNNNSIPEISRTFKNQPFHRTLQRILQRIPPGDSEGSKRLGAESLESSRLGAFLNDSTPTGELVVSKMITPGDVWN